MLPLLLLLPLLWGGSLQEYPGYKLQIPELVTVQEGLCVIVFCEFFYPWHVSFTTDQLCIYWYWTGDNTYSNRLVATNCQNLVVKTETQGRFHLLGDPKTNNCSLSIRDARKSDTGIYEFRVWGQYVQYSYRTQLNLQVTDLTEKADIHILEPLQSGSPTNLTCSLPGSCDGGRPLTFSWMGDALNMLDPSTLQSSVLTLTPRPQDHGTYLTCQVKRRWPQVTTERTIRLNVSYPPQMLGSSCSWEAEGVHCSCFAQAWPAPFLHWWIGDRLVEGNSSDASFSVTSSSIGPWTKSSLSLSMELTSVLRLCCEAWNDHGNQSVTVLLLPGKSASRAEVALGALGGAGTMALLSLCLCLTFFFIVKARRKQAAERPGGMDDEDPVMGTVTWSCRQKPWPESTPAQQSHSGDTPPSREEQDVHYASLSFHGMKPQKSKDEEATSTTEYTEIKTSK
ncbi:sialic acid-binding Ig-like lectin 5 isoform X2 [Trichechus manatus latirostris]|uniref:Sialic acid-binding Ig-like lectin 5 isoform X2 n=1 Tax=Trichechus manatus latirostris TaxID=127582 RepID=A0A2Y9RCT8_TRIMA|nr:sialic acid-binding Ig-like lectin 5 isoform X2 [Trichechus manatus latirostris]